MDGDGDCFQVSADLVVDVPSEPLTLVHGTVVGTGVPRHPHAWVEFEEDGEWMVLDRSNGHHWVGPRDTYYRLGQVQDVKRYTRTEAFAHLLRTEHYGPWDV